LRLTLLACVDVDYRAREAVSACLLFQRFTDERAHAERVARRSDVAAYEPGAFFRRELPCLMAVLELVAEPLDAIVIDGYVWLAAGQPGLGAHLHRALDGRVPIIGVAKTAFRDAPAREVMRGSSRRPLYVTAEGVSVEEAARCIESMHGAHRIPTLLGEVDRLGRTA
jgi:deoxyribonuclease V